LQVCVTSPALAPWAQIPLALAAGIANAPPGVAELVKTAIALGADADALSPIIGGLPPLDEIEIPAHMNLLSSREEAIKAEEAVVADLASVGVKMSEWTPAITMKVPKGKPTVAVDGALRAVAMRSIGKARRCAPFRGVTDKVLRASEIPQKPAIASDLPVASDPQVLLPVASAPQVLRPAIATPARAAPNERVSMEVDTGAKLRGTKRLLPKTRAARVSRGCTDIGDID